MGKVIKKGVSSDALPIKEGDTHYDLDFRPLKDIVEKMNEIGYQITLDDLIHITEERLLGRWSEPPHEEYMVYTLIVSETKELKN